MRNLFALTPMALALCTASAAWADEGKPKKASSKAPASNC
ncbi:hypothetical protein PA6761_00574 [Pseudomonas aeruginosa]